MHYGKEVFSIAQSDSKVDLIERKPIPRAVAELSIPMVVTSLVMVVYNLADTFFVGMLGDPVQNAAVTLVYPVMLAFNAVNNLFGIGTSSMMSRELGKRDYEKVRICSAFGFYGALFSGLAFALLCTVFREPLLALLGADTDTWEATADYLFWVVSCGAMPAILNVVQGQMTRAEGAALHASIGTMSGCILNILLDPIFILPWGLNLGAAGAGLATFLSNCAACGYFLILARVKKGNTFVCMEIRKLKRLTKEVVGGVLAVGVPASIQNLLNVTGSAILNNFTASYGASAVAAMGVANKVNNLPMQICLGLSFLSMDFLAVGVFAALGMGKSALIFALLRKVVLEIPLLFVLNRLVPLYGIAYAQFLTEVVLSAAAVVMLVRIFRRCKNH